MISSDVIEECERTSHCQSAGALPLFAAFVKRLLSHRVEPTKAAVHAVAETIEAKDAPIIAGAMAAKATFVATYDRKHLLAKKAEIGECFTITVATPTTKLKALGLGDVLLEN